jgi:hypothetical protein
MKGMRSAGFVLATALVAACGGEMDDSMNERAAGPVMRDSAGVRIVESGEASTSEWRVDPSPRFTLGWGPEAPTFTWLQSGRILEDGGALVGDFGSGTIYRLGADGSVTATWGRKGEGPGEYQGLDAILTSGDSIIVSDGRLRRVTVLSPDGEVVATRSLGTSFLDRVSSVLSDGRMLLVPGEGYSGLTDTRPEWVFETQPIVAVHPADGSVDTLAQLPHLRRWYGTRGGSPGPLSVRGRAGGFADGFAWARADRSEVRWYDAGGRLRQVARWDEEPIPLTSEVRGSIIRAFEEAYAASGAPEKVLTAQREELHQGLDRYDQPLPYWDAFHVDRVGNVWLREHGLPLRPSERWRVLARDGTFVGWVDVPEAITVLDITDDRILAVRLDDFDEPAVVMLELVKE